MSNMLDIWYDGTHGMTFYAYNDVNALAYPYLSPLGNKIGHTWRDFGLIPSSAPVVVPAEQKVTTIDIPGANGSIDVTDQITRWPLFNNRSGSWDFYLGNYFTYAKLLDNLSRDIMDNTGNAILASREETRDARYTRIQNRLHGKRVMIVFDDDPDYYWYGRVRVGSLNNSNDNKSPNGISINYDLYPYKFKIKPTRLDIDTSASDPHGYIVAGSYPVIPTIYTLTNGVLPSDEATFRFDFNNKEIGIKYVNIEWRRNYPKWSKLENLTIGNNKITYNCYATNLSGSNKCLVTVRKNWGSLPTKLSLYYRVGDL